METKRNARPHILAVDDEPAILEFYKSVLSGNYQFSSTDKAEKALRLLETASYDLIISDISIPGMDGIRFINEVRKKNKLIPVILVTGHPSLDTAIKAIEFGALRYLTKPVEVPLLEAAVEHGVNLYRMSSLRDEITEVISKEATPQSLIEEQKKNFDRAMDSLWLAFQPIISWSGQCLAGYEALVRNDETEFAYPPAFFGAAEHLGRTLELSRRIRSKAAAAIPLLPPNVSLFVNLCPQDLDDPELYAATSPL